MKKRLLLLLLAALTLLPLHAYDFYKDGLYYNINDDGNSCAVTYKDKNYNTYSGDIVIPSSVTYNDKTYSVRDIGNDAFKSCFDLISVSIPNSIIKIGDHAFYDCFRLTSVAIPNSVTEIVDRAFSGCSGVTSVTIPNSVTKIGRSAFSYCTGLTSVTIGNSVTEIGDGAFSNCTALTSVNILDIEAWCKIKFGSGYELNGSNPITYAKHLFLNGEEVRNLIIPNSVTKISKYAFSGCTALISVTIGNSVTNIGNYAFWGCTGLTSVTIGNAVTEIGYSAFSGCAELISVEIGSGIKSVGDLSFINCSKLQSLKIDALLPPSANQNCFTDEQYRSITLYIPKESKSLYESANPWNLFLNNDISENFKPYENGIEAISADSEAATEIFDLKGRKITNHLESLPRGIYILRQGNSTQKIAVK